MKFILALGLLLSPSCAAAVSEKMASWAGSHQSALISSWGAPQQVMSDGQGGQIFAYHSSSSFTMPGNATTSYVGNQAYTTYNPGQTITTNKQRLFWINSEGYVYKWSWKGL